MSGKAAPNARSSFSNAALMISPCSMSAFWKESEIKPAIATQKDYRNQIESSNLENYGSLDPSTYYVQPRN